MKQIPLLLAALLAGPTLLAQQPTPAPTPPLPSNPSALSLVSPAVYQIEMGGAPVDPATGLPIAGVAEKRFDLDFRGGTPQELVDAIGKARSKPVNAIIPDDVANTMLPAMKLKEVTVPRLFEALTAASQKTVTYRTLTVANPNFATQRGGMAPYQQATTSFGFRTQGVPNDDAIWTFFYEQPAVPPPVEPVPARKEVMVFQLAPYLDTFKIDDITTAIQTGWKMLDQGEAPEMNFHKDTKLLIAVGDPAQLVFIQTVLQQLGKGVASSQSRPMIPGQPGVIGAPSVPNSGVAVPPLPKPQ